MAFFLPHTLKILCLFCYISFMEQIWHFLSLWQSLRKVLFSICSVYYQKAEVHLEAKDLATTWCIVALTYLCYILVHLPFFWWITAFLSESLPLQIIFSTYRIRHNIFSSLMKSGFLFVTSNESMWSQPCAGRSHNCLLFFRVRVTPVLQGELLWSTPWESLREHSFLCPENKICSL